MSPLQITLIIIFVLLIVTIGITYFIRNNFYKKIDDLNIEKNNMLELAPYDQLKEVDNLNLTGQSLKIRKDLKQEWEEIESKRYPLIENYLCDAESATDDYRLGLSKKNQEEAEEEIKAVEEKIKVLTKSLSELIEKEQANLKKIDSIKKRYHNIRKSLLAYSFSFGPASETFEEKLNLMETSFADFSDLTVSGDHEEANYIVNQLSEQIHATEENMDEIPPLLTKINEDLTEKIADLNDGYINMTKEDFLFPNDTILEDIEKMKSKKAEILKHIKNLEIEQTKEKITNLTEMIEVTYQKMEKEIEIKPLLSEFLHKNRKAIYYLNEKNRRLKTLLNRISQSYILNHNEAEKIIDLEKQIGTTRTDFAEVENKLTEKKTPFSTAYIILEEIFNQLSTLNKEYQKLSNYLEDYRVKELSYKNDLTEMEHSLYEMKRALENERLPGLPADYLELFFSTSDRVEKLSSELARTKLNLIEIQSLYKICEEDMVQLSKFTEEIIRQVELLEITSQRLYRYKDSHKGILETIRYSETLFSEDYDYETALKLVSEKLENVESGLYEEIVEEYEDQSNDL